MDYCDGISLEVKIYNILKSDKDLWNAVNSISSEADIKFLAPCFDALEKKYVEKFPELLNCNFKPFYNALRSAVFIIYLQKEDFMFV